MTTTYRENRTRMRTRLLDEAEEQLARRPKSNRDLTVEMLIALADAATEEANRLLGEAKVLGPEARQ